MSDVSADPKSWPAYLRRDRERGRTAVEAVRKRRRRREFERASLNTVPKHAYPRED